MLTADTNTALDGLEAPPCAKLLGWRLLAADPQAGWIRVGFEARAEFTNPAGDIQGGFLAAMLDDTMGPAVFVVSEGQSYAPTIEMHVSFLKPARPGRLVGEGRVIQLGKSIAFLEGSLTDEGGALVARATASARVMAAKTALG